MDLEKTMEFIVDQQAKIVAHEYRIDRRLDGITKLIQTGMRVLARHEERLARLEEKHARLEERFARSEKRIERLLAALLRQGPNGRR